MNVASIILYHKVFIPPNNLRNIITGVTSNKDVNACESDDVGRKIIEDMRGKQSDKYTFKQKSSINCISINGENINLLTVRSQFDDQSLECHLKYAMFTQKCHQNHQKMEYSENTHLIFSACKIARK